MTLEDRVAIVTGSSMGIGQGIAALFLEHGARVVVNSRHQGRADAAADRLAGNRYGDRLLPIGADVADPDAAANMVQQTMARWGQIDILVNNAGINAIRPSEELPA